MNTGTSPSGRHGYSGKPLSAKLGLKPGMSCLVVRAPDDYLALLDGAEGITFVQNGVADMVHLFCKDRADLEAGIAAALSAAMEGGMVWISWPKKSSSHFVDLTEDGIREVVLPTGWVDVKVCAVDGDWSGLKFLRRRKTAR